MSSFIVSPGSSITSSISTGFPLTIMIFFIIFFLITLWKLSCWPTSVSMLSSVISGSSIICSVSIGLPSSITILLMILFLIVFSTYLILSEFSSFSLLWVSFPRLLSIGLSMVSVSTGLPSTITIFLIILCLIIFCVKFSLGRDSSLVVTIFMVSPVDSFDSVFTGVCSTTLTIPSVGA